MFYVPVGKTVRMFDVFSQSVGSLDLYAAGLLANWIGLYENFDLLLYIIELLS